MTPDASLDPIVARVRDRLARIVGNALAEAMQTGVTPQAALLQINTDLAVATLSHAMGCLPPDYHQRVADAVVTDALANAETGGAIIRQINGLLAELDGVLRSGR